MLSLRLTIFCLYLCRCGENKGKLPERGARLSFWEKPSPAVYSLSKVQRPTGLPRFCPRQARFRPPRGRMPGKV